jgi:hypothetical protein
MWSTGYILTFFKNSAIKHGNLRYAEETILELKRINNELKKKKSKYEVIYPKVDSPLYNMLNDGEDDD